MVEKDTIYYMSEMWKEQNREAEMKDTIVQRTCVNELSGWMRTCNVMVMIFRSGDRIRQVVAP